MTPDTSIPLSPAPPSTLRTPRELWKDLATRALNIVPARIPPHPDAADLGAVDDDLGELEDLFTKIVVGYGEAVTDNFPGVDPDLFQQLKDYVSDSFSALRTHLSNVRDAMQEEENERDSNPRRFERVSP